MIGSGSRIERLSDDAWLLRVEGDTSDAAARNRRIHAVADLLQRERLPGTRDIVPAYDTLAVFFDAAAISADSVSEWMLRCASQDNATNNTQGRLVEILVYYGGDDGPDLASAAMELGISPEVLVQRHTAPEYTVAMIGFAPGFPYLLGLDPRIALPRLATPRTRVPAGSIAIGGAQTGIYPRESPGGWRLIGRTPLILFDPQTEAPSLLQPGDRLRFLPASVDGIPCN